MKGYYNIFRLNYSNREFYISQKWIDGKIELISLMNKTMFINFSIDKYVFIKNISSIRKLEYKDFNFLANCMKKYRYYHFEKNQIEYDRLYQKYNLF